MTAMGKSVVSDDRESRCARSSRACMFMTFVIHHLRLRLRPNQRALIVSARRNAFGIDWLAKD